MTKDEKKGARTYGGRNLEGNEEKRRGDEISRQVDNPYAHSSGVGREGSTKYRLCKEDHLTEEAKVL